MPELMDRWQQADKWTSNELLPEQLALALAAAALALIFMQYRTRAPAKQSKGVLGETCAAPEMYTPGVLFPIPRTKGRRLLNLEDSAPLPFRGEDVWNCYEFSWLDKWGRPRRGVLELRVPCETANVVESKSLKLYLNSFNFKRFESPDEALATVKRDVASVVGCLASELAATLVEDSPNMAGWTCIDDVSCGDVPETLLRRPDAALLKTTLQPSFLNASGTVSERLCSHNLRTLCPVTGQPDWGTLLIEYEGPRINRASLFRYIASLRTETGFHENAVERVALDVDRGCKPTKLRVTGRFLRRGGIDINPVRAVRGFDASAGLKQARAPGQ